MCGGSHSAAIACQGRKKTSVKHEKGLGSVSGQARLKPPSSPDCAELSFEVTSERDLWTTKRPTGHYLQKRNGGKSHKSQIQDETLIRLLSCLKLSSEVGGDTSATSLILVVQVLCAALSHFLTKCKTTGTNATPNVTYLTYSTAYFHPVCLLLKPQSASSLCLPVLIWLAGSGQTGGAKEGELFVEAVSG